MIYVKPLKKIQKFTQYDLRQALEENSEVYNQIPKLSSHDVA